MLYSQSLHTETSWRTPSRPVRSSIHNMQQYLWWSASNFQVVSCCSLTLFPFSLCVCVRFMWNDCSQFPSVKELDFSQHLLDSESRSTSLKCACNWMEVVQRSGGSYSSHNALLHRAFVWYGRWVFIYFNEIIDHKDGHSWEKKAQPITYKIP